MTQELLTIGKIRTSFGVKGWMKIFSYSGEWEHFRELKTVILEDTHRHIKKEYRVKGFQMHHGGGILKLENISTPEQVKFISGWNIIVPREMASQPGPNEWYITDLIGLTVVNSVGTLLGEVVSIIETCDDLLEVMRSDGRQFMIPFRKEFVSEPDMQAQKITLFEDWLVEN